MSVRGSLSSDDARTELFSARFCSPGDDHGTVMVCSMQTWAAATHSLCDLKNSNQLLIIYFNKSVRNLFSLLWGCMRLLLLLAGLDPRWPHRTRAVVGIEDCFNLKLLLTFVTKPPTPHQRSHTYTLTSSSPPDRPTVHPVEALGTQPTARPALQLIKRLRHFG